MIKINCNTYIQLFTDVPDHRMTLSGWDSEAKYIWGFPIYIIYTKKLIK